MVHVLLAVQAQDLYQDLTGREQQKRPDRNRPAFFTSGRGNLVVQLERSDESAALVGAAPGRAQILAVVIVCQGVGGHRVIEFRQRVVPGLFMRANMIARR